MHAGRPSPKVKSDANDYSRFDDISDSDDGELLTAREVLKLLQDISTSKETGKSDTELFYN